MGALDDFDVYSRYKRRMLVRKFSSLPSFLTNFLSTPLVLNTFSYFVAGLQRFLMPGKGVLSYKLDSLWEFLFAAFMQKGYQVYLLTLLACSDGLDYDTKMP